MRPSARDADVFASLSVGSEDRSINGDETQNENASRENARKRSTATPPIGSIVVEVFESERFFPFLGWQEPKGQLDEFFTARFSRTVSGKRYEFLFIFVIIFALLLN